MTNSRDKGKRGEREVARWLRDHGYAEARRGCQYSGEKGNPDVVGLDGVHIEVKYREQGHGQLYDWLAQSKHDSQGKLLPIVMHRKNNCEWLVTMRAEDFIDMYGEWNYEAADNRPVSGTSD